MRDYCRHCGQETDDEKGRNPTDRAIEAESEVARLRDELAAQGVRLREADKRGDEWERTVTRERYLHADTRYKLGAARAALAEAQVEAERWRKVARQAIGEEGALLKERDAACADLATARDQIGRYALSLRERDDELTAQGARLRQAEDERGNWVSSYLRAMSDIQHAGAERDAARAELAAVAGERDHYKAALEVLTASPKDMLDYIIKHGLATDYRPPDPGHHWREVIARAALVPPPLACPICSGEDEGVTLDELKAKYLAAPPPAGEAT